MKTAQNTISGFNSLLLSIISRVLLTGCAGMGTTGSNYVHENTFKVNQDISLQEATDLAALALQDMEVAITEQNEASGFLSGRLEKGWWVNRMSFL